MPRQKYYLFVDEVKNTPPFLIYNFTGVAIKAIDYPKFQQELNLVKNNSIARIGGSNLNLHFTKLISRKEDFKSLTKIEESALWNGLGNLFENTNFNILAGAVNAINHKSCYQHYCVNLENLAFKILIQNFVRYLHCINGYGEIVVESSNDDEKLREDYYINKLTGGKYITAQGYNQVLRGIVFKDKTKLIEGLQLVDFMANPVSRLISNMDQFKIERFYNKTYEEILQSKIFDGGVKNPFEFGIRKIF